MSSEDTAGKIGHDDAHAKSHAPHGGGHGGGGGGHDEEEHTGAPEWLISFADNTALLMGFFVIMLALAMAQKGTKSSSNSSSSSSTSTAQAAAAAAQSDLDFVIGVRQAFHNLPSLESSDPGDQAIIARLKERRAEAQEDNVSGHHNQVQSPARGENYAISALVIFDAKQPIPSPDSHKQIAEFAEQAKGINLVVEVRGHTSTSEVEGDPVAAMQLSYERAFQVGQELVSLGVPWNRIRLIAVGSNERDGGELTFPDRKAQNQRVELILTSNLAKD